MAQQPLGQIQLDAFGAFGAVDLPLHSQLNVLVGANATGKSQLMKMLFVA